MHTMILDLFPFKSVLYVFFTAEFGIQKINVRSSIPGRSCVQMSAPPEFFKQFLKRYVRPASVLLRPSDDSDALKQNQFNSYVWRRNCNFGLITLVIF